MLLCANCNSRRAASVPQRLAKRAHHTRHLSKFAPAMAAGAHLMPSASGLSAVCMCAHVDSRSPGRDAGHELPQAADPDSSARKGGVTGSIRAASTSAHGLISRRMLDRHSQLPDPRPKCGWSCPAGRRRSTHWSATLITDSTERSSAFLGSKSVPARRPCRPSM